MKVKLEKLKELVEAESHHNVEVGHVEYGELLIPPIVGVCMEILRKDGSHWHTSMIEEIIDINTFRTRNSIYHWEYSV